MSNQDQISRIVVAAVEQAFKMKVEPQIEYPEPQFGDFSTNVPFILAKTLKLQPKAIAQTLADAIKDPLVESAEAAGAGFLNFTMTPAFWSKRLDEIGPNYGRNNGGKGQKVQVEFISANPTGPLTLGNARGGFTGDVLARVLSHSGYDVTREYYFNDAGTQIRKLVESVKSAAGIGTPDGVQYSGEYIKELAGSYKTELVSLSDQQLGDLLTQAIFKRYIKDAVSKMGIKFDVWFNERTLVTDGGFVKTLERLKEGGFIYEKDGATWLKSSEYDPSREDRVLIKSNGDITYLGNDLAYHINIFEERRFDYAIKMLGPDHVAQFPSVKLTLQQVLPGKRLEMAMFQWVRLIKGGKEVKISKRAGNIVTVEDLIGEVGADVARFFFLMRSAGSQMDFDLDLAKEQSQKNPLFYLMYAYVRAHAILAQAAERKLVIGDHLEAPNDLERQLIRQMGRLPNLVNEIAQNYEVHKLGFYGLEVAKVFHDYYESARIIDLEPNEAKEKLYLIQQYIVFMKLYFALIGVTPIEKM